VSGARAVAVLCGCAAVLGMMLHCMTQTAHQLLLNLSMCHTAALPTAHQLLRVEQDGCLAARVPPCTGRPRAPHLLAAG
jgi:hypothetical protein